MRDLGSLPGYDVSWAYAINSSGTVVGYVATNTSSGTVFHGFLFDCGKMMDLNDLVAPSGWTIIDARDINDSGQIAAVATGFENGKYVVRALLLNPDQAQPPRRSGVPPRGLEPLAFGLGNLELLPSQDNGG
jgi:probable HAF family extracellular repeat protein